MSVPRPETITMRDVAAAANVSVATVSRFYNGSGPVGEATRRRIERVAQELRYVPNAAARIVNTRRTDTVGVLLPDLYGEFFSELLRGFDQAVRAAGLHLLVASARGDADELAHAARALHGRVDGIAVMSPEADADTLRKQLSPDLPLVVLGGAGAAVAVDNRGGAREATRHLLRLGHRRVAHLRGAPHNQDAEDRLLGYTDALAEASDAAEPVVYEGSFDEASGVAAVEQILSAPADERPTALFAANDAMAVGALAALRQRGLSAPNALALVGFDDVPLASHLTPALTSVHVPIAELGAVAIEQLRLLEAGKPAEARTLPATLVVRASCGGGPALSG